MGINLLAFSLLALTAPLSAESNPNIYPRLREQNEYALPKKFRISSDSEFEVTASSQFSEEELRYLLESSPEKNHIVVDLRREFHGYVNGYPVSWKLDGEYGYNYGLTSGEIEAGEKELLAQFPIGQAVEFRTDTATSSLRIESVATEREIVSRLGAEYVRIPVSDHYFPTGEEFIYFLQFIRSLPKNASLHFHCAGGEGRTTVFLAMIDMMHNSKTLSFEEILKRQEKIGGANLYDPDFRYADQPERMEGGRERLEFLRNFYNDCQNL